MKNRSLLSSMFSEILAKLILTAAETNLEIKQNYSNDNNDIYNNIDKIEDTRILFDKNFKKILKTKNEEAILQMQKARVYLSGDNLNSIAIYSVHAHMNIALSIAKRSS
ncbi:MAG: hypothetical protein ACRC4L_00870 [Mycoplasma sp.]